MNERKPVRPGGSELEIQRGVSIRVHATGILGKVIEVGGDRVTLEARGVKLDVDLSEIEVINTRSEAIQGKQGGGWRGPELGTAGLEVDLHGMRVDEVELELSRAVDHAILENLPEIRVIHGKGTGAIRKRVAKILEEDTRAVGFCMGYPYGGGVGVTIGVFGQES